MADEAPQQPPSIIKLPASNPGWSTGLISLVVSLVAGFASFYTLIRPEVTKYMETQAQATQVSLQNQTKTTEASLSVQSQMVTALLGSIQLNTNQISNLQVQLTETKEENTKLKDRVTIIEQDFNVSESKLKECLNKLKTKGK